MIFMACVFITLSDCTLGAVIDKIKLVEGKKANEGRVEVYVNGIWGSICNTMSTDDLAASLCQRLGYPTGIFLLDEEFWEPPKNQAVYQDLTCTEDTCSVRDYDTDATCESLYQLEIACGEITNCHKIIDSFRFTRTQCDIAGYDVFLCPNSTTQTYRRSNKSEEYCFFTNKCEGEGQHYQICGCPGVKTMERMCTGFICFATKNFDRTFLAGFPYGYSCDGYWDCDNHEDEDPILCEETINDNETIHCRPKEDWNAGWVIPDYQCDSENDCLNGEDEMNCGHNIGFYCKNSSGVDGWVDRGYECDGNAYCQNDEDEKNCNTSTVMTCQDIRNAASTISINKYQRCTYPDMTFVKGHCAGYIDQLNCTDDNVIVCDVSVDDKTFINTRVRKNWMCNEHTFCDDGIDEECSEWTKGDYTCKKHKHLICDNNTDCPQGDDEKNCEVTPEFTCQRRLIGDSRLVAPIPVSWLCDGVVDCSGGEDEDENIWMVCGQGYRKRCLPKSYPDCTQGFVCPDKPDIRVQFNELCDYHESCMGSETELCRVTKGVLEANEQVYIHQNTAFMPPCIPGLINAFGCSEMSDDTLIMLSGSRKVVISKDTYRCTNTFGLQYRLMACASKCTEEDVFCNITDVSDTTCDNDNIYKKLDSNNKVKRFFKVGNNLTRSDVFVCKNKKCIDPWKYCNLIDDCGDNSDEENCINSFRCASGSPRYIRAHQKCDDVHDCFDSSDECNSKCSGGRNIINGVLLKISAFVIGVAATIINIYTIVKGIRKRECSKLCRKVPFTNQMFISLIAMGDLCVGIYLLNIFVIDFIYKDNYCINKYDWLTSDHCSFIGVLTTFGSQLSLFAMVSLSIHRATSMQNPFGGSYLSTNYVLKIIIISIFIIVLSLLIGLIPILDVTEDYFTNGMYYKDNTVFNKITPLSVHTDFLNMYLTYRGHETQYSYSWAEVRQKLTSVVFTEGYPNVIGKNLKFYGNSGVCLFKYFVSSNDPQREFTLSVISINMVCFIIITVCYILIISVARKSVRKSSTGKMEAGKENGYNQRSPNSKLQTKISLIIFSDFLCWIPFSCICMLHTLEIIDATPYYQFSSIILIPINSCINPIIYSNATSAIWASIKRVNKTTRRTNPWKTAVTVNTAVNAFRQGIGDVTPSGSISTRNARSNTLRYSYTSSSFVRVSPVFKTSITSNLSTEDAISKTRKGADINRTNLISAAKMLTDNTTGQIISE